MASCLALAGPPPLPSIAAGLRTDLVLSTWPVFSGTASGASNKGRRRPLKISCIAISTSKAKDQPRHGPGGQPAATCRRGKRTPLSFSSTPTVAATSSSTPTETKAETPALNYGTSQQKGLDASAQLPPTSVPENAKKRIVVLGCGWGGMTFARGIDTAAYDVTMVSPRSYFLFTPLLPSVTTGLMDGRSVAEPIRSLMAGRPFVFLDAECVEIDPATKTLTCRACPPQVRCKGGDSGGCVVGGLEPVASNPPDFSQSGIFQCTYDYLVIAVGAQPNTFGIPGVAQHCLFLKELKDAVQIRGRVLSAFEAASLLMAESKRGSLEEGSTKAETRGKGFPLSEACDGGYASAGDGTSKPEGNLTSEKKTGEEEEQVRRLLHFVVVGGGPTGVEFAAELCDLIEEDLSRLLPHLAPFARITIIEAVDHILNMFDQRISDFAEKKFSRQGIQVLTGKRVMSVEEDHIVVEDKETGEQTTVAYGTAVWATGIGTRPVLARFMERVGQHDRRALGTDEWLRVLGTRDVWAIGDCSTVVQRPLSEDVLPLFEDADKDKDGTLSAREFQDVIRKLKPRYPQVALYLRRRSLRQLTQEVYSYGSESEGDVSKADGQPGSCKGICLKEFGAALKTVDSQVKALPATAQVAAQQGEYLAGCFNAAVNPHFKSEGPPRTRGTGQHRFKPFRYLHLGQFAPLGSGKTGVQLPGDVISVGTSTQWLWYSVYAVRQVSWRTRAMVLFDWLKGAVFGRDLTKL